MTSSAIAATEGAAGARDASEPAAAPRRITKLSEATINRIAAGEVRNGLADWPCSPP